MHLPPNGREFYKLTITTTPATLPTEWEASFDDGQTWTAAVDEGGASAWLLAGPDAPNDGTPVVATITADLRPQVRLTDNPEVVVRSAPAIFLAME